MKAFQRANAQRERRQKNVVLTLEHEQLLDRLKETCGISHSGIFRRGIELVAKEFEPVLKSRGINLGVINGNG